MTPRLMKHTLLKCAYSFQQMPWNWLRQATGIAPLRGKAPKALRGCSTLTQRCVLEDTPFRVQDVDTDGLGRITG